MTIPNHQYFMLPILKYLQNQEVHSINEIQNHIIEKDDFTEEEKKTLTSSGKKLLNDRISWANTYIHNAGLIKRIKRGHYQITEDGLELLKENHETITIDTLMRYKSFENYYTKSKSNKTNKNKKENHNLEDTVDFPIKTIEKKTPLENIETNYNLIQKDVSQKLLENIFNSSPKFFERLVVDLLIAMGYGGSRVDAGKAIGKTNDEGIDGIIKEDVLGLDNIYIQAKRWKTGNNVGRQELQKFVGALSGKNSNKGIFITTSKFSKGAKTYVENISSKIILIDGQQLTKLMFEYNVGVSTETTYEIKRIDSDYFYELN